MCCAEQTIHILAAAQDQADSCPHQTRVLRHLPFSRLTWCMQVPEYWNQGLVLRTAQTRSERMRICNCNYLRYPSMASFPCPEQFRPIVQGQVSQSQSTPTPARGGRRLGMTTRSLGWLTGRTPSPRRTTSMCGWPPIPCSSLTQTWPSTRRLGS